MPRCTFDADEVSVPGDLADDWRCPRTAVEGGDHCAFHDPDALSNGDAAGELLESLSATPEADLFAIDLGERRFARERKRFVGARLSALDLSDELIERGDTHPLDLRGARIGALDCHDARIEADFDLGGSRIGTVDATDCVVDGDCSLRESALGPATHPDARVDPDADGLWIGAVDAAERPTDGGPPVGDAASTPVRFDDARVGGRLVLTDAVVNGDVEATECVVDGRFEFKRGAVEGRLYCPGLTLRGERHHANTSELTLRLTEVRSHVVLEHLRSRGALLLNDLHVGGDLRLDAVDLDDSLWLGAVDDESTTLGPAIVAGNLSVRNGGIGGDADLAEARTGTLPGPVVDGCLDLSGTTVAGALTCTPRLADTTFPVARLRRVTVGAGSLSQPTASGPVGYDLRNATLGDVRLGTNGGSTDRLHLVETTFDGFVFGRNRDAFEAADWRIHEVPETVDGDGTGYRGLATATVAADAMALADDLLAAAATFEGFRDALSAADPVDAVATLVGARVDFAAIAGEAESSRESALPEPFDDRESDRVGLVRGLAAVASDGGDAVSPAPTAVVALRDPDVRAALGRVDPDAYPAHDPGKAAARGELQSAIAPVIADVDAEVPDAETLVTTYVLARNGANRVGDTNAASRFFRNEMLQRRRVHRKEARARGPPRKRLAAASDYVSNALFDLSSGYGERPGRVLTFSGSVVFVFAGAFAVLLPEPPYGGVLGYGLLSLESFVALILGGGTVQSDLAVRLAATLEGFVGAFLIALFVFALTRSLER
ncbi:hypothetical protein DJ82_08005 [Halorubrum sp. Ib24]|uniref:hypothetical protein n=1 Tax=Halorubrum sp. Ib24 TaxID=1383850 RepID=UPI000B998551|nr:hypothetical protein [Halorubrum sp. Ib24]OYR40309.1 hypothetical protein DJ82_08005 [Halorubrum sp. Ib24]